MNNAVWRIQDKGKDNLACLLKDHQMCGNDCEVCESSMERGHCFVCGLIAIFSDDVKLEPIKLKVGTLHF